MERQTITEQTVDTTLLCNAIDLGHMATKKNYVNLSSGIKMLARKSVPTIIRM